MGTLITITENLARTEKLYFVKKIMTIASLVNAPHHKEVELFDRLWDIDNIEQLKKTLTLFEKNVSNMETDRKEKVQLKMENHLRNLQAKILNLKRWNEDVVMTEIYETEKNMLLEDLRKITGKYYY